MTIHARVSLADVLRTPVVLTAHDAVAVIVQLAHSPQTGRSLGERLDPSDVWLERGGAVTLSPGLLPPLREVAALLDQLLGRFHGVEPERIPPGLRAIVKRAADQHAGTSIASWRAFAAALAPFHGPDPAAAVRLLIAAADEWTSDLVGSGLAPAVPVPAPEPPLPVIPGSAISPARAPTAWRPSRGQVAAGIAATVLAAAIGVGSARLQDGQPQLPAVAAAAPADVQPAPAPQPAPEPLAPAISPVTTPPSPATAPASDADSPGPNVPVDLGPARLVDRHAVPADGVFSPSFAANGTAVLFHAKTESGSALKRAEGSDRGELRVATIVDDGARNYHVRLSPDGAHVAFDSDRDGARGVYVADADGHGVHRVSGPGYAAVPTWSSDGRRLAYLRSEPGRPSVWNLWLLDRDSGRQARLTSFRRGQVWGGAWFSDGRRIAYSHDDRLIIHDLASGRTQETASPVAGRLVRTPAVSPDGRWIVFQVARDGVWLLDVERGTVKRVLDDVSAEEFAWSPDGRRVAYHSRRSGGWNLWAMAAP